MVRMLSFTFGNLQLAGHASQPQQQLPPSRLMHHRLVDGIKHPLHATVQGVVFQGLPMGAVRHLMPLVVLHFKTRMATPAVSAPIFQMGIWRQIVPTRRERHQVLQLASRQLAHRVSCQHHMPLLEQLSTQLGSWGELRVHKDSPKAWASSS